MGNWTSQPPLVVKQTLVKQVSSLVQPTEMSGVEM